MPIPSDRLPRRDFPRPRQRGAVGVFMIISLLLLVPMIWVLAAMLCSYAWLRGRSEPVSATSLSAEASSEARA